MLYSPQHSLDPEGNTENKTGKKKERKIEKMKGMKADNHRAFIEESSSLILKYYI